VENQEWINAERGIEVEDGIEPVVLVGAVDVEVLAGKHGHSDAVLTEPYEAFDPRVQFAMFCGRCPASKWRTSLRAAHIGDTEPSLDRAGAAGDPQLLVTSEQHR
jgi:hypothetical protein